MQWFKGSDQEHHAQSQAETNKGEVEVEGEVVGVRQPSEPHSEDHTNPADPLIEGHPPFLLLVLQGSGLGEQDDHAGPEPETEQSPECDQADIARFLKETTEREDNAGHGKAEDPFETLPADQLTPDQVTDHRSATEAEEDPGEISIADPHPFLENVQSAQQRANDYKHSCVHQKQHHVIAWTAQLDLMGLRNASTSVIELARTNHGQ